jgi:hypothetical protein
MIGGMRFHRSVKTRSKWLYLIVPGQVSGLSFHILVRGSHYYYYFYAGLDDCDFNGHLSNSSYAKVVLSLSSMFP